MADANELIYQNANTYRLHADNLRWTLLGGYAAFLAAVVSLTGDQLAASLRDSRIAFLGFLVSFAYLGVLAVQNWFYNLFAQWVGECEARLVGAQALRPLNAFAQDRGKFVNPYHPAFFLAQFVVGSVAYYFLAASLRQVVPALASLSNGQAVVAWLEGLAVYFAILNLVFLNWNRLMYEGVVVRLSNLYKPVDDGENDQSESA